MNRTPHELKEHWLNRALATAGIDRYHWQPSAGVDRNRRTIEAVYDYYSRMFLDHSYLKWAGMASMVGPAFYAGFRDLGVIPDAVRGAVARTLGRGSRTLARWAAGDLGFYETTFLIMQRKIFEDQATMHEAYIDAGVDEIEKFYAARIIDAATLAAWQQIDRGRQSDADLVNGGNRTLLLREQRDIIDRLYVQMLGHRRPEGSLFTYLLTLAGAPSVPGAHAYSEVYPLSIAASLPGAVIRLRTPLPDGNIAVFADRWRLIETDTLPDYLALIEEHPERAREILSTPISDRVGRYRLLARVGDLAAAGITQWDLNAGRRPDQAHAEGVASKRARALPRADGLKIDLTTMPSRASMGFAPGRDSNVWITRDRSPIETHVALPDGRAFGAEAAFVVAESSTIGGDPDRLQVVLGPADLAQTLRRLSAYARDWDFPEDAVARWRADAERRASSDRAYSTHVFTASDATFVHIEFQVSHHVRDGYFVAAALFSWDAAPPGSSD